MLQLMRVCDVLYIPFHFEFSVGCWLFIAWHHRQTASLLSHRHFSSSSKVSLYQRYEFIAIRSTEWWSTTWICHRLVKARQTTENIDVFTYGMWGRRAICIISIAFGGGEILQSNEIVGESVFFIFLLLLRLLVDEKFTYLCNSNFFIHFFLQ